MLSAPTLMSDSSTLRFARRTSTREHRSVRLRNSPSASRESMIDWMAPSPTFFTARSPKRMASPSTVKPRWLLWTSGVRTSIPRRRHSAIAAATLSALSRNADSTEVMYSTV